MKYEKTSAECRVEFPADSVDKTIAENHTTLPLVGIDLEPMQAIMVSTGDNLNDDVFLAEEIDKAMASIPHKPVNEQHRDKEIRGHIVEAMIVEKTIKEGGRAFDVVTNSVLYKLIFPEFVKELKEKILSGKAFVSMEAYFPAYDYKVGAAIVKRNSATAFLDKHLRVKGGTGAFDGVKVKRVLRNIVFGGMGVVDRPANPDSIVLAAQVLQGQESIAAEENKENLWTEINKNCVKYNEERIIASVEKGDQNMSGTATTTDVVKEEPAKTAEAAPETPAPEEKKCADCGKSAENCSCAAVKAAAAEVLSLKEEVASLTAKLNEALKSSEVAKAALEAAVAKSEATNTELVKIRADQLLAKRLSDFADFDIASEDLPEINDQLKSLDDAAYAKFVAKANRLFKKKVVAEVKVVPAVPAEEVKAAAAEQKIETAIANKETAPIKGSGETNNSKATATKLAEAIFINKKESK